MEFGLAADSKRAAIYFSAETIVSTLALIMPR